MKDMNKSAKDRRRSCVLGNAFALICLAWMITILLPSATNASCLRERSPMISPYITDPAESREAYGVVRIHYMRLGSDGGTHGNILVLHRQIRELCKTYGAKDIFRLSTLWRSNYYFVAVPREHLADFLAAEPKGKRAERVGLHFVEEKDPRFVFKIRLTMYSRQLFKRPPRTEVELYVPIWLIYDLDKGGVRRSVFSDPKALLTFLRSDEVRDAIQGDGLERLEEVYVRAIEAVNVYAKYPPLVERYCPLGRWKF